jgi:hypothetical protein
VAAALPVTPYSISLWSWGWGHGVHWDGEGSSGNTLLRCAGKRALACLVKVAQEQIISTSNLNILKSRNNIESCWSYCKVLLHFFKQSKTSWRSDELSLYMCQTLGFGTRIKMRNEAGEPWGGCHSRKIVPAPRDVWFPVRLVLHCLNRIPGTLSELQKTVAINNPHPGLKIEAHFKQKKPGGEMSRPPLTSEFIFQYLLFVLGSECLRWRLQGEKYFRLQATDFQGQALN